MKYQTKTGGYLIIPRKSQDHLRAHPEMFEVLPEVASRLELPNNQFFLQIEVEMDHIIGRSGRVETLRIDFDEQTLFATRIGRDRPTRVIVGEQAPETSVVSILAFPDRGSSGNYVLITAWMGPLAPKEPWDPSIKTEQEYQESLDFWSTHALIHDPEVMDTPFTSSWEQILGQ